MLCFWPETSNFPRLPPPPPHTHITRQTPIFLQSPPQTLCPQWEQPWTSRHEFIPHPRFLEPPVTSSSISWNHIVPVAWVQIPSTEVASCLYAPALHTQPCLLHQPQPTLAPHSWLTLFSLPLGPLHMLFLPLLAWLTLQTLAQICSRNPCPTFLPGSNSSVNNFRASHPPL